MDDDSFFKSFDRDFARAERSVRRTAGIAIVLGAIWVAFLIGAISTAIFLLGRWLGVW